MAKSSSGSKFDLEERTAVFGESAISCALKIARNAVTIPLISQFVRTSTSIGANYCEADEALTRKEFKYRIGVCTKEARETKYWLRMLAKGAPKWKSEYRVLWREADELNRIFASIARKTQIK